MILRMNCVYHHNRGPNVADVLENCRSLNINCIAYDSLGSLTAKADFSVNRGATMRLFNCYTKNSTSNVNIINEDSESNIYNFNSQFDTTQGSISQATPEFEGEYLIEQFM